MLFLALLISPKHYHDSQIYTITKQSGIPYSLHPYEEPFYTYIPAIDYQGFLHE